MGCFIGPHNRPVYDSNDRTVPKREETEETHYSTLQRPAAEPQVGNRISKQMGRNSRQVHNSDIPELDLETPKRKSLRGLA